MFYVSIGDPNEDAAREWLNRGDREKGCVQIWLAALAWDRSRKYGEDLYEVLREQIARRIKERDEARAEASRLLRASTEAWSILRAPSWHQP